jgi:sugar lactone lactonase YvrE
MKTLAAEPLFNAQNDLGEGPLWHPIEKRLYWVDITAGDLYRSNDSLTDYHRIHFETPLGAAAFTDQGGFLLATGDGFALWSPDEKSPQVIWNPDPDHPEIRLNDGQVDPAGRFWAGSIDMDHQQGHLYRIDPDSSRHTVLDNIGISNGLGWSPDRKTMYYTDSYRYAIYAFDYDLESGRIGNRRIFVRLRKDRREVVPDGLCVDAEGCVWSAQWNGEQVVRYGPDGEAILAVSVPAQRVTSCCFGGPDLKDLFITTARTGLSDSELADQPLAGDVFRVRTETQGQPANLFHLTH